MGCWGNHLRFVHIILLYSLLCLDFNKSLYSFKQLGFVFLKSFVLFCDHLRSRRSCFLIMFRWGIVHCIFILLDAAPKLPRKIAPTITHYCSSINKNPCGRIYWRYDHFPSVCYLVGRSVAWSLGWSVNQSVSWLVGRLSLYYFSIFRSEMRTD